MLQHSCQRVLKPAARLVARQQLLRTTHSLLTAPPARSYCRQHPACSAKPTLSRWLPAAAASATLRSKQQLRAAATDTMATDAAVNSVLDSLYSKAAGQEEASIAAAPSASAPAAQEQQAAPAAAPAANMDTMLDDLYGTAGEEAAAPAPELEPAAAAAAPAAAPGTSAPCFSPNPQVKRSASPPEPAAAVEAPRVNPLAKKLKQAQARAATPSEAPTTTIIKPPTLPEDLSVFQNAALLVDKPAGWTSFNVCNELKTSLERVGIDKVSHAVCRRDGGGAAWYRVLPVAEGAERLGCCVSQVVAAWRLALAWLCRIGADQRAPSGQTCAACSTQPGAAPLQPLAPQRQPDACVASPCCAGGPCRHAGPSGHWSAGGVHRQGHQGYRVLHVHDQAVLG